MVDGEPLPPFIYTSKCQKLLKVAFTWLKEIFFLSFPRCVQQSGQNRSSHINQWNSLQMTHHPEAAVY